MEGYGYIDGKVGMYDDDRTILSAINDLRKYSRNYFKNHPITLVTKSSKNSSDFDLILEVKSSTKLNNCFNISMSNSAN